MKQSSNKLICLITLLSTAHLIGSDTISKLIPRSQSMNAARNLVGWNNPNWGINRKPQDDNYHAFNLTFEYTRTFRGDRLARCFFGDDLTCACDNKSVLNLSGTGALDVTGPFLQDTGDLANVSITSLRENKDWLSDYFGLPANYKGSVCFDPRIDNFILDFSYYAGLDEWVKGMYFRIHAPFVHTRWSLGATESAGTAGNGLEYLTENTAYPSELIPFTGQYPPGYFSPKGIESTDNLNCSFLNYTNGCTPNIEGIKWQPLCCSRINNDCTCDALTRNGFGEIRFVLGWNFINDEEGDYHLGTGLYVAAPTGTRVGDDCEKGKYLFEPIVGNGKHWELGAQVTAHRIWWRNEQEDKSFGAYLVANVTHMFDACQTRCFDLCSAGSNSRYMLAQRLVSNRKSDPRLSETSAPRGLEFGDEFAPVANLTRRDVDVSIGAQGDVALSFAYQSGGFQWDIGYGFWGRSCEDICIKKDCCSDNIGKWALKGIMFVYGFHENTGYPVALAATNSKSTVRGNAFTEKTNGTTFGAFTFIEQILNFTTDEIIIAQTNDNTTFAQSNFILQAAMFTSENPVLIKEDDFDMTGARGISHKVFTNVNWAWPNRQESNWTPWVSVGAEAEFGKTVKSNCKTDCKPDDCCPPMRKHCIDCAISQWGVWFKVGGSYN